MASQDFARIGFIAHEICRLRQNIRANADLYASRLVIDGRQRVQENMQNDSANSVTIARALKAAVTAAQADIAAALGSAESAAWLAELDVIETALISNVTRTLGRDADAATVRTELQAAVPETPISRPYPDTEIEAWPGAIPVPNRRT